MTDSEFKKSTKNKSINDFTYEELFKACEFECFEKCSIISVAKANKWDDIIKEANSYESDYDYFGHKITV